MGIQIHRPCAPGQDDTDLSFLQFRGDGKIKPSCICPLRHTDLFVGGDKACRLDFHRVLPRRHLYRKTAVSAGRAFGCCLAIASAADKTKGCLYTAAVYRIDDISCRRPLRFRIFLLHSIGIEHIGRIAINITVGIAFYGQRTPVVDKGYIILFFPVSISRRNLAAASKQCFQTDTAGSPSVIADHIGQIFKGHCICPVISIRGMPEAHCSRKTVKSYILSPIDIGLCCHRLAVGTHVILIRVRSHHIVHRSVQRQVLGNPKQIICRQAARCQILFSHRIQHKRNPLIGFDQRLRIGFADTGYQKLPGLFISVLGNIDTGKLLICLWLLRLFFQCPLIGDLRSVIVHGDQILIALPHPLGVALLRDRPG